MSCCRFAVFASAFAMLFLGFQTQAEPWIANRFAQNCAACHAPGRINLKPKDRRCTLSCQGCHVNPNGGGMRNRYGTWNQQRWLRSYKSKLTRDYSTPAPLEQQAYWSKKVKAFSAYMTRNAKRKDHVKAGRALRKGVKTSKRRNIAKKINRHQPTKFIKKTNPPEKFYDQYSNLDWLTITAKNRKELESRMPYDDPYKEERTMPAYFNGNLRYIYGQQERDVNGTSTSTDMSFLMAADLGVRFRPFDWHKFSAVLETRYLNGPNGSDLEEGFTTGARVRSAYVLFDDLMWNTYFQAGLYRPMFGHYNIDHTALAQEASGLGARSVYKAVGFGAAPNIPFFVFNYIQPMANSNYSQDEGFVISAGGRFVTMGASTKVSFWSTEDKTTSTKRQMLSLTAGAAYKGFILNVEGLRVERDVNGTIDKGSIITMEGKYQFYRENYAVLNFAVANTDRNLKEGSATEMMGGVKSFLLAGTELELLYINRNSETKGTGETKESMIQLQGHLFF